MAAGHATTCDTNISTGVESANTFCRAQQKVKKGDRWSSFNSSKPHTDKYTFEKAEERNPGNEVVP